MNTLQNILANGVASCLSNSARQIWEYTIINTQNITINKLVSTDKKIMFHFFFITT